MVWQDGPQDGRALRAARKGRTSAARPRRRASSLTVLLGHEVRLVARTRCPDSTGSGAGHHRLPGSSGTSPAATSIRPIRPTPVARCIQTSAPWRGGDVHLLGVPIEALPEVVPSSGRIGLTSHRCGVPRGHPRQRHHGDQQAALFGQASSHRHGGGRLRHREFRPAQHR